jgi:hypothetical protein
VLWSPLPAVVFCSVGGLPGVLPPPPIAGHNAHLPVSNSPGSFVRGGRCSPPPCIPSTDPRCSDRCRSRRKAFEGLPEGRRTRAGVHARRAVSALTRAASVLLAVIIARSAETAPVLATDGNLCRAVSPNSPQWRPAVNQRGQCAQKTAPCPLSECQLDLWALSGSQYAP